MSEEKPSQGHPVLMTLIIGLMVGFGMGWWFPPPASMQMDRVRSQSKQQFSRGAQRARGAIADFSADLSERLREDEGREPGSTPGTVRLQVGETQVEPQVAPQAREASRDEEVHETDLVQELDAADQVLENLRTSRTEPQVKQ